MSKLKVSTLPPPPQDPTLMSALELVSGQSHVNVTLCRHSTSSQVIDCGSSIIEIHRSTYAGFTAEVEACDPDTWDSLYDPSNPTSCTKFATDIQLYPRYLKTLTLP